MFYAPTFLNIDEAFDKAKETSVNNVFLANNGFVVYVGSTPQKARGRTNMFKLSKLSV